MSSQDSVWIAPLDLQQASQAQELLAQLWQESDQFTVAEEEEVASEPEGPAQTWLLHCDIQQADQAIGLASIANREVGLAVLRAYQGQGYGQALLEHAIAWAREQDLSSVWLEVVANNAVARHIYQKYGFQPVATRVNREGQKLIRMELALR
ncbi:GNAT family N-acetyltransferase [Lactobacillaceae bacterium L1_55_11]|nr:GNAT family N-acetyltransferase [Lactobacillaceae bacterium L1_55_11]